MCSLIFFISWQKNCSGPCELQKKQTNKQNKTKQDNTNKQ